MSRFDLVAERKNQIIKATIDCITRYGYSHFSMQDVAQIANVSKGIIHYYFLNKEDLMMAVLNYVSEEIEGMLISTEANVSPIARLSNVIWVCSSIVQNKKEYYCINIDFWTQINQKEKVREEISAHYSKFRHMIAGIVQQGIDQGIFRKGDALQYASMVLALIDGTALQWLFDEHVFNYTELIKNCEEAVLTFLKV